MRIDQVQTKVEGSTLLAAPLLNVREASALLRISVPTFWRRVADGTVPKPLKIGSLSRWHPADIETVIRHAADGRAPVRRGGQSDEADTTRTGGAA